MSSVVHTSSHCQLANGDNLADYCIVQKLGQGRFSRVWAANDLSSNSFAIKVYRIGAGITKYYENEVKICSRISAADDQRKNYIIEYLGTFVHDSHPCVVFGKMEDSLSNLIQATSRADGELTQDTVKSIMRQLFSALSFLHENNIIHADIKPGNILMDRAANVDMTGLRIRLADLGSSTDRDIHLSEFPGTAPYVAPELIIGMPYDTPIDIWAAMITCFELLTCDLLFDAYRECDLLYGSDIDSEPLSDDISDVEDSQSESSYSSTDSRSSGSDDDYDEDKINYHHLLLIAKLLGYPPDEFINNARPYYNPLGHLTHHPDLVPASIADFMQLNYNTTAEECVPMQEFLLTGLKYTPADRITAQAALDLPWLN